MKTSRGEDNFVNLPALAAKLYGRLMRSRATQMQYKEIAHDLHTRIEHGRLLDVGTGPGYLLREIHNLNPLVELYGLDISSAMVELAGDNLADLRVDLQCGDVAKTSYEDDFFDLITCTGSFYLWDHPIEGLEEIHRILKLGGSAYLYETHRDVDGKILRRKMMENLKGENPIIKILAPRFFIKQIAMTYDRHEIIEIIERTSFRNGYAIDEISIFNLPAWLRVELKKTA